MAKLIKTSSIKENTKEGQSREVTVEKKGKIKDARRRKIKTMKTQQKRNMHERKKDRKKERKKERK